MNLNNDENDVDTPSNLLLMVTEVPNVESSCYMIKKMLPPSKQENVRIQIVYVEDDVQTFDEYIKEGWNSQTLEMQDENNLEKTSWDKMKSNWRAIFLFLLILTSFMVFVLFISMHLFKTNGTSYKDCYDIGVFNATFPIEM